jgi:hypothetical protein
VSNAALPFSTMTGTSPKLQTGRRNLTFAMQKQP